MNIDQAKKLKVGDVVRCPEDMGAPAFTAKVQSVGPNVAYNARGEPYVWVSVKRTTGHSGGVWPSNRLT